MHKPNVNILLGCPIVNDIPFHLQQKKGRRKRCNNLLSHRPSAICPLPLKVTKCITIYWINAGLSSAKANSRNLKPTKKPRHYLISGCTKCCIKFFTCGPRETGKGKRCGCSKRTEEKTDVRVCIKIYAGINAYGFRYRKEGKQEDGLQPCTAIAITVLYRPFLSENHPCVGMRRSLPEGLNLFPFF